MVNLSRRAQITWAYLCGASGYEVAQEFGITGRRVYQCVRQECRARNRQFYNQLSFSTDQYIRVSLEDLREHRNVFFTEIV